MTFENMVTD